MKLSAPMLLAGLVAVGAMVVGFLSVTRDAQIRVNGEIQKVRTAALNERASLAILDFRISNPAGYPYMVRTAELFVETKSGEKKTGTSVADMDVKRLLAAFPILGPKYNDTIRTRERFAPKTTIDKMIASRFEFPLEELDARARFVVRIEDVDGAVNNLVEKR
jgi:hypothetical protein